MELKPKFDHKEIEANQYNDWLSQNLFEANSKSDKEPFSIILPPPNVTGKLHLGHAWDGTLQDALIRFKKMQGYEALWLPGMDHAGIATQAKVEERLREEGINIKDLSREKFLEKTWQWKEEYANHIRNQWGTLGFALDYSRETFTLDEHVSEKVKFVFKELYEKGFIYKGMRITNWDPKAQTAISDIEVIYKEVAGSIYHVRYQLKDSNEFLELATTRPETMFGDVALAVNPNDERYKKLIGTKAILPIVGRELEIIADDYVDMEFGTGVVKITPAHDPNDYEMGKRHNLEQLRVMNLDGTMNEETGSYQGLSTSDCRKKIVKDLEKSGNLVEIKEHINNVGHSERSGAVVEPLITEQWYVKMKELAKHAMENQKTNNKVEFFPERFENTYSEWMENIQDWCISRQLWWGHQIPVWYHNDTKELVVGEEPLDIDNYTQDEDVLDTWFSSALWPMVMTMWSTEKELEKFFPTNVIVTGYDIIFFWVSRMMFQSLEFTNKKPFNDALIHGLIRAEDGRKMSKSLGNGIDPMEVVEQYGADSLRLFLLTNSSPGQDLRYSNEKLEASWNFINKVWNISRYVIMNTEEITNLNVLDYQNKFTVADDYILSELNKTISHVNLMMDKYEFGEVGRSLNNFIRGEFADWYVEISKIDLNGEDEEAKLKTKTILKYVLKQILKLLHPFLPFVTTKIYDAIDNTNILLTSWPEEINVEIKQENIQEYKEITEIITAIRNVRAENDIKPSLPLKVIIQGNDHLEESIKIIKVMGRLEEISYTNDTPKEEVLSVVVNDKVVHIINDGIINNDEKIKKLEDQQKKLLGEITRSFKMLSNDKFVGNANPEKIKEEVRKGTDYLNQYDEVLKMLSEYDIESDEKTIISDLKKRLGELDEKH